MSTSVSAEIERAAGELTAALMALTHAYKSREAMANNESASSLPRKVLSDMAKLQALLYEPADFLQQLSVQVSCTRAPTMSTPQTNTVYLCRLSS